MLKKWMASHKGPIQQNKMGPFVIQKSAACACVWCAINCINVNISPQKYENYELLAYGLLWWLFLVGLLLSAAVQEFIFEFGVWLCALGSSVRAPFAMPRPTQSNNQFSARESERLLIAFLTKPQQPNLNWFLQTNNRHSKTTAP